MGAAREQRTAIAEPDDKATAKLVTMMLRQTSGRITPVR